MTEVVLDMVVSTDKIPPRWVLCTRNGDDIVVCSITDKATSKKIAEFKISKDLLPTIPQLLQLYI